MKPRTYIGIGLLQLLIIITAGLLFQSRQDIKPSENTYTMRASYPIYNAVGDISKASHLIISGKVVSIFPSRRVFSEPAVDSIAPKEIVKDPGYLLTDVEVQIDSIVQGDKSLIDKTIIITHPGGTDGISRYEMEDEPMSVINNSYLFFLTDGDKGKYVIVSGAQGRYLINKNIITRISPDSESPVSSRIEGLNINDFEAMFSKLIKEPAQRVSSEKQEVLIQNPRIPSQKGK